MLAKIAPPKKNPCVAKQRAKPPKWLLRPNAKTGTVFVWRSCFFVSNIFNGMRTARVFFRFLARDAFVRTNRRAIAMVFRRLSVLLSVCLSEMGVHYDHTMHVSADFNLWLDSPMFWAPWHQHMSTYFQPSFSSSTWKRDVYGCAN